MKMKTCKCGKSLTEYANFCSWDCHVQDAKDSGFIEHRPNGLPIKSITANGLLLECEHGDHPDYVIPVEVEYIAPVTNVDRENYKAIFGVYPIADKDALDINREIHAVIYCDDNVILTLNECSYSIWAASDGISLGGFNERKKWRIVPESLRRFLEVHHAKAKAKVPVRTGEETYTLAPEN